MARKAKRYLEEEQSKKKELTHLMVGIYARLSVDAEERKTESIENQIAIIQDYIRKRNSEEEMDVQFVVYDIYTDYGKTGTNFEREGFERLMRDVRAGQIDCIMVKDFSRFGRNYIETGNYIEKILPFLGVRFISISDGYDSDSENSGHQELTMNIKNLVNDMYAKDISRKESISKRISQKNGDYVGSIAPYGYEVEEVQGMHRLSIVPEAAEVVQWIFKAFAEGTAMKDIRMQLYDKKVHRPSDYRKFGHVYQCDGEVLHEWGDSSVRALLCRQNYYGDLVQHKYESGLLEGKKCCRITKEEEWIIMENTHEAIISKDLFRMVQSRLEAEKRRKNTEEKADFRAFTNVMYCGKCGRKMVSHRKEEDPNYYCPAAHYIDNRACHKGKIKESKLQEIVKTEISNQIRNCCLRKKELGSLTEQAFGAVRQKCEEEKQQLQRQKERMSRQNSERYLDYKEGRISRETYLELKEERIGWEAFFQKRKKELEQEEKQAIQRMKEEKKYLQSLLNIKGKKKLNADLVESLVDKILLYEDGRLEIVFRLRGGEM